jgi:hypothetical protein
MESKIGRRTANVVGKTYNNLTVIGFAGYDRFRASKWACLCVCGQTKTFRLSSLVQDKVKSCGCMSSEIHRQNATTHGLSYDPCYTLWKAAQKRAQAEHLEFAIELRDIVIPDRCPVFGIRLERNSGRARDNSPSLDRIIPKRGYVKGNICVISWKANRLKKAMSLEEIRLLYNYMETHCE